MKALVKSEKGVGHVSLHENWPRPIAKPGWVVLEVAGSGICGTDIHIMEDLHKNWPPVVLGHEYAGRIVELGEGISGWKIGDRVVCEQHTLACMECDACRRGAIHLCPAKRSPGWGIDGAFADYVTLPGNLLHKIPDGVTFQSAIVTEPTAICLTGLDRANLHPGERVLVIGPGPIGIITALLARASGASEVTLIGRTSSTNRLALAASLGIATREVGELNVEFENFKEANYDLTVDTTGAPAGLALAIYATRRLGRVLELGLASNENIELPLNLAMSKSISILMSISSEYSTWNRALALMESGIYDPTPLTSLYALEEWQSAFKDVEKRKVVKAILAPHGMAVMEERD